MPTYKLGCVSVYGIPPDIVARRPLICERCAEALGNVDSLPDFHGMTAHLAAVMWPEMKEALRRHEAACRIDKSRAAD